MSPERWPSAYLEHDGEPTVRCGLWWLISGALLVLVLGALVGVLVYLALAADTVPVSCT